MELVGLLGIIAFAGASLVVGLRLLWLARRTRQYPELAIGASFLLAGFFGLGCLLVAQNGGLEPEPRIVLTLVGNGIASCGYALLASFIWRVFRPTSRAGKLGFAATVGGLALGFGLQCWQAEPTPVPVVHSGFWLSLATQIAAYTWGASESFSYWWRLRKRLRLGMADPLITNRFLLWGIGTSAVIGIWLHLGWTLMRRSTAVMSGADYLVIAVLGFTCAIACWVAFLPPKIWVRRFARQAA